MSPHSPTTKNFFKLLKRGMILLLSAKYKRVRQVLLVGILLLPAQIAFADIIDILRTPIVEVPAIVGNKVVEVVGGALASGVEAIAHLVFMGAGIFMEIMGAVLDTSITFTVQSAIFKNVGAIQVGWTAVRDFSNMFFIFVLLYIAILTVLGIAGSNAKRWVAHLIIAALLINFSLFATQVVVDAGNILAVGFWDKMKVTTPQGDRPTASLWFMEGFRIQTTADVMGNARDPQGNPIEQGHTKNILVYLGGTGIYLVAGYVFLAGAIMMIVRSVTLMILMIVSPFAFLGFALPKGGGFASQWLNKLISSTFVAPAFIFMLYIDSLIIRGTTAAGSEWIKATQSDQSKLALAFGGTASNFPIIYNFLLMIILLLASLKVADSVSSGAGSSAGRLAKSGLGYGAAAGFTGVAAFGRQTGGSFAHQRLNNEKWVTEQNRLVAKASMKDATFADKARARLANAQLATYERASKGTFDIRNAPMGGLGVAAGLKAAGVNPGAGSKQTFETKGEALSSITKAYRGTDKEKELIGIAKSRYADNPGAQEAFLKQRGVDLGADRNKDIMSGLNKDKAKEEAKESLKKSNAEYDTIAKNEKFAEAKEKLAQLKAEKKKLEDEGKEITADLTQSIKNTSLHVQKINDMLEGTASAPGPAMIARQSVANLTSEQVAKLMEKNPSSEGMRQALRASDYTAINKRYMEGGYKETMAAGEDRKMMENITVAALKDPNVPENAKKVIKNAMKSGTWGHNIDFQGEIAGIVTQGKDEHGNYVPKASLSPQEQKQLNEIYSMLDNDDVATLHDSLHTNPHLVEKYSPKTLASINKRQYEVGGDTNTEYVKGIRDAVAKSKNEKAKQYINNNRSKETSIFKGQEEITTTKSATDSSARWRELAAKTNRTAAEEKELQELTKKP